MGKILTIVLLLFYGPAFCQEKVEEEQEVSKNTIYFELLGNAGVYSLNYDRVILDKEKIRLSSRIGFSHIPRGFDDGITNVLIELNIQYWQLRKSGWIEFGVGASYLQGIYSCNNCPYYSSTLYSTIRILSYRYQRDTGGYFFRAGILAMIETIEYDDNWKNNSEYKSKLHSFPFIGFSFGYTFKKGH